ncbi:MAG: GntG family PLP-dependent aldolase [Bacteroidota bacterium]
MDKLINLISDTVTQPTPEMLAAMMQAQVGDDVFRSDPCVNQLEQYAADLFGMEAALFCPSGTMTNQIAIQCHTNKLEEVICHEYSHVYQYETGGFAYNARIGMKLLPGPQGKINAQQVEAAINPDYDWLPASTLVVLENTCNKGGGAIYQLKEIEPIKAICDQKGLNLHLDGARLFNALAETQDDPKAYGQLFNTISICLSKGLGAPVGSLLIGNENTMKLARRLRKVMGGGMRQAGFLAAAGLYALQHHVDRLFEDHQRARTIASLLETCSFVDNIRPVETNILIFDLTEPWTAAGFLEQLQVNGVLASPFGPKTIRFVTHLDFDDQMLERTLGVLKQLASVGVPA